MNFLKKGPEIKLSKIKVPGPVRDVYLDLKERHLLPLAVILLLAIVIVPFALSSSSSEEATTTGGGGSGGTSGATAVSDSGSGELIAKSAPGLRDYKRRLDHLTSKNPFRQQYQHAEGSGEGSGEGQSGEEGSTTIEGSESSGEENVTEFTLKHHLIYYSYAIDVKVTTGGGEQETRATTSAGGTVAAGPSATAGGGKGGKTQVRHNLPELTMLPSRETPAVIYMGSTKDGKKALMLVSSAVNSIFGDAPCALGSTTCELLAMEPGLPETFIYGDNNRVFKIEVLQIHLVESDKLEKAPLGKPHKHPEG
jgi:hypothetical protein